MLNNREKLLRSENPTLVLAGIARFQYLEGMCPRNRDLTDELSLTKGAISNNCAELVDGGLIEREDNRFRIDEEVLLTLYCQHLDPYFIRERSENVYQEKVNVLNDIRTYIKSIDEELFSRQNQGSRLLECVKTVLLSFRENRLVSTMREVFLQSDRLVRKTGRELAELYLSDRVPDEELDQFSGLLLLAAALDHDHKGQDRMLETLLENPPEDSIDHWRSDALYQVLEDSGLMETVREYDPVGGETRTEIDSNR